MSEGGRTERTTPLGTGHANKGASALAAKGARAFAIADEFAIDISMYRAWITMASAPLNELVFRHLAAATQECTEA